MARHRQHEQSWTRPSISAIALLGVLLTAYLTGLKWTGSTALCPSDGCETALNSDYGTLWGLPLSLFGLVAYGAVGLLGALPWLQTLSRSYGAGSADSGSDAETDGPQWQQQTWMPLFLLTTAMVLFSGYLVYLLVVQLQTFCLYCSISAGLSLSLWVIVLVGRHWEDLGSLLFNGALVAIAVFLLALSLNPTQPSLAQDPAMAAGSNNKTQASAPSSAAALALAQHLQDSGAIMYGAYWCPHCQDQKRWFGAEAALLLPYVECDAKGENGQPEKCRAAGIDGFPTWKIGDQTLSGTQSLADLAKASGYQGSTQF